jgi:cellobiose dehydrogenase (acceptor)
MRLSFTAALLAPLALAQSSVPFTDPATGIAFQAFQHASGFKFGVALPKDVGGDFIGLLVRFKRASFSDL